MGKKSGQASKKASKNQGKQLHSLIKVLKPRVYITDCSNFKQLVQELTGCGDGQAQILTQPIPLQQHSENIPIVDISSNVSTGSVTESCREVYQMTNEEVNWPVQTDDGSTTLDLTYGNLESWLLDLESCSYYEGFSQNQEQINVFNSNPAGLF